MNESLWFTTIVAFITIIFVIEFILDFLNQKSAIKQLPFELNDVYAIDEYDKMRSYHKQKNRLANVQSTLFFVGTIVIVFLGLAGWFSDFVLHYSNNQWVQFILFFSVLSIISAIFSLPFELIDTFVIEEKFGFNKLTVNLFIIDKLKSIVIAIIILAPLSYLFIYLIAAFGTDFWLILFVVVFALMVFIAMFFTSIFLPLFNKLSPLQEGDLRNKIQEYCTNNNFSLKNVFVMDGSKRTSKANAFFSGLGPRKIVVLYDTLIEKHSTDEIVAIIAHEVGHYKLKHSLQSLLLGGLSLFIMLYIFSLLLNNNSVCSALGAKEYALHLVVLGFGLIYSPINFVTGILINIFSRKNEYAADSFAASTYKAHSLIIALKKLSANSYSNLTPHPLYVFFHYSHPTLLQRINNLSK